MLSAAAAPARPTEWIAENVRPVWEEFEERWQQMPSEDEEFVQASSGVVWHLSPGRLCAIWDLVMTQVVQHPEPTVGKDPNPSWVCSHPRLTCLLIKVMESRVADGRIDVGQILSIFQTVFPRIQPSLTSNCFLQAVPARDLGAVPAAEKGEDPQETGVESAQADAVVPLGPPIPIERLLFHGQGALHPLLWGPFKHHEDQIYQIQGVGHEALALFCHMVQYPQGSHLERLWAQISADSYSKAQEMVRGAIRFADERVCEKVRAQIMTFFVGDISGEEITQSLRVAEQYVLAPLKKLACDQFARLYRGQVSIGTAGIGHLAVTVRDSETFNPKIAEILPKELVTRFTCSLKVLAASTARDFVHAGELDRLTVHVPSIEHVVSIKDPYLDVCPLITNLVVNASVLKYGRFRFVLEQCSALKAIEVVLDGDVEGKGALELGLELPQVEVLRLVGEQKVNAVTIGCLIEACPNLRKLDLYNCSGLDFYAVQEILRAIPDQAGITHLRLRGLGSVRGEQFGDLAASVRHPALRSLDLSHNPYLRGTEIAPWLQEHSEITHLNLHGCRRVQGVDFVTAFKHAQNLNTLLLHGCRAVDNEAILTIMKLIGYQLTDLNLNNTAVQLAVARDLLVKYLPFSNLYQGGNNLVEELDVEGTLEGAMQRLTLGPTTYRMGQAQVQGIPDARQPDEPAS